MTDAAEALSAICDRLTGLLPEQRACAFEGCNNYRVTPCGLCADCWAHWCTHRELKVRDMPIANADVIDEVELLIATDHAASLAARLGYTASALNQLLRRAGRNDLARYFDRKAVA